MHLKKYRWSNQGTMLINILPLNFLFSGEEVPFQESENCYFLFPEELESLFAIEYFILFPSCHSQLLIELDVQH